MTNKVEQKINMLHHHYKDGMIFYIATGFTLVLGMVTSPGFYILTALFGALSLLLLNGIRKNHVLMNYIKDNYQYNVEKVYPIIHKEITQWKQAITKEMRKTTMRGKDAASSLDDTNRKILILNDWKTLLALIESFHSGVHDD